MIILESEIICPACGFAKTEEMPTNACIHFYECEGSGVKLKPQPGDCCVFCSYSGVKCPPKQEPSPAFKDPLPHKSPA